MMNGFGKIKDKMEGRMEKMSNVKTRAFAQAGAITPPTGRGLLMI